MTSGFTILAGFMRKFAYPKQIADAFLALYFVGVLLALVRHYTGNIAGCIGLHAGIVTVVMVIRKVSSVGTGLPWIVPGGPLRPPAGHLGRGGWTGGLPLRLATWRTVCRAIASPGRGHLVRHGNEHRLDLPYLAVDDLEQLDEVE